MSSSNPTELRIGAPGAFNGSYKKSTQWLNTIWFYLLINNKVYNDNNKKVTHALSYMTKGSTLTWATTFHQSAILRASVKWTLRDFWSLEIREQTPGVWLMLHQSFNTHT